MSLVDVAGSRRGSDIYKPLATIVPKQNIGKDVAKRRRSRAQVEVKIAVVIDVAEVRAHRIVNVIEAYFPRYVFKSAVPKIAVQFQSFNVIGKLKLATQN